MLSAELDYDPRLQFAVQQNDVPVVGRLRLSNLTDARLDDLTVRLALDPPVGEPWEGHIAAIDPGADYNLGPIHLELSAERLATQTEREAGYLVVDVARQGANVLHETHAIEVLAYNEWSGTRSLPELLAAFVLPNHPSLAKALKSASRLLGERTGSSALDGYQSGQPERVLKTVSALYDAVAGLELGYVNPPASFEVEGQKVRTPDQILRDGLGTCLDLTLLLTALLEQAGLSPVIVLTEGHAFPGTWLSDWHLPETATDDPLPLKKRVELGEALVFDSSAVAQGVPFDRAVQIARRHLEDPGHFRAAIDVRSARLAQIRPLPMRLDGRAWLPPEPGADEAGEPTPPSESLPDLDLRPAAQPAAAEESTRDRVDRWRSRLLDLSLRNRLLNFKATSRTLPLLSTDPGGLEDVLAGGAPLVLEHRPDRLGSGDPRDPARQLAQTGAPPAEVYTRQALAEGRLTVDLDDKELAERALKLYRSSRSAFRETGAITLYVALGFLEWFESDASETARRAPILLLPAELDRPSVRDRFRLRLADDEPLINQTLLEKLSREFGYATTGLDAIPEDDSGWDVSLVLKGFRQLVLDTPRWRVVDECWLAEFSFEKFLMWRDLTANLEALEANSVVEHLLDDDGQAFPLAREFTPPASLDQERPAWEDLCVVDADSSQLSAVYGAVDGNSFVLQGPPGTGKSQTITNLVALVLAEGKTVLFVSEKMAALEVVHRRLDQVGLGPFCLELHSHKASKSSVVQQLGEPFKVAAEMTPEQWRRHAETVQDARTELNRYVERIHRPGPFGESLFQATSRLIGLEAAPRRRLEVGPEPPSAEDVEAMRHALADLAREAAIIGTTAGHPWQGVGQTHHTPRWQREVEAAIEALDASIPRVRKAVERIGASLELAEVARLDAPRVAWLADLSAVLLTSPAPPLPLLVGSGWDDDRRRLEACLRHGEARSKAWSSLAEIYEPSLLDLDVDQLHRRFARWAHVFFLIAFIMLFTARRSLRDVVRQRLPGNRDVEEQLETARQVRERDDLLEHGGPEAEKLVGKDWRGPETDWQALRRDLEWAERFRELWGRPVARDDDGLSQAREPIARRAAERPDELRPDGGIGRELTALVEAVEAWGRARESLVELLQLDLEAAFGPVERLDNVREQLDSWRHELPRLREWCDFGRVAARARELGLEPVVDDAASGELGPDELLPTFERALREWWLEEEHEADTWLADFRGRAHQDRIEAFRVLDRESQSLARQLVRARLAERLPNYEAPGEMATVRHLLNLKRPRTPIRKLFSSIRMTLSRIKPCLLMSPLSIAQYLDPELEPFDVVVFDEASQIPPWDALGAIARGSQVIVVGDSKQLPPTTFFQRGVDDETALDDDDLEELESILEECDAAGLPRHHLRWHYRSRHESLIAFSNYHYYDNGLHTFPSAADEVATLGVKWRHVPGGFYDRGRSATNRAEAEAVVAELVSRLSAPGLAAKSVGIVTFSLRQQRLIEDLIDEARRARPDIEPFFADGREEPVFVKNLENVQGDERDVMMFSIGYGPDKLGRVTMNFGPLNRDGGERRLNVAVTRARELLIVFSTLRADQIDLSRTRARGVRDLKTFLDYADRGPVAIDEAVSTSALADFDSPFERSVAEVLEDSGWEVDRQVGCANYRIDLAVVDPDRPGNYLIGVECDGASYHSARSARDRDRIRQAVLERLGWRLTRIWSTEWLHNRDHERARLLEAVNRAAHDAARARRVERATPVAATASQAPAMPAVATPAATSTTTGSWPRPSTLGPMGPSDEPFSFPKLSGSHPAAPPSAATADTTRLVERAAPASPPAVDDAPAKVAREASEPAGTRSTAEEAAEPGAAQHEPTRADGSLRPPYAESYRVTPIEPLGDSDDFDQPASERQIADRLRAVLLCEAPVHVKEACRRVSDCWSVSRLTKRVRQRVLDAAERLPPQWQPVRRGAFLWLAQQNPQEWRGIRLPDGDAGRQRDADDLPPEEVANAAEWLVQEAVAIERDDLVKAMSDLFEFGRLGRKVRARMEAGIDLLVEQGRCVADGDRISVPR